MSLGDPNPSPERDPKHSGASPKRPQLLVRELDPIGVEMHIENLDRLTDLLHLCGLTPSDEAIEYVWRSLLRNELPTIEDIHERQGPLGVSLELDISTKHELECRSDLNPDEGGYDERASVTISTRHREGSEIGALLNLSEGCPGLDGLFLELQSTPLGEAPALARIYWDEEGLAETSAGERWDLLRGFHHHFRHTELPDSVSLTSGQKETFHYLLVDLDPMTVRVQRIPQNRDHSTSSHPSSHPHDSPSNMVELRMEQVPLPLLEKFLSMTGALQLEGPWVTDTSRREILAHLLNRLASLAKFDIDTLKMCAAARPCIIFSREDSCDGDIFPPQISSRVTMTDYTCAAGEFRLELLARPGGTGVEVLCRWHKAHSKFSSFPWDTIQRLALPYVVESTEE